MNGPSRVRMGGGGRKMRPRAFWPPSPPNRWLPASLYCLALASKAPQFKACHAPLCPKLGEHEEERGGKGGFEASESSGWSGGEGMARSSRNGKELPNAPFTRYMCPTFMSSAGPTRIYISFPLKSQSPFNFSQSRGIIKSAPQKVATKPRA